MPNFEKEAKLQFFLFLGFPMIGAIVATVAPRFGMTAFAALVFAMYGYWLFVSSKLSLKKRTKVLVEWGEKGMTKRERIRYRSGYGLMALATVLLLVARPLGWA